MQHMRIIIIWFLKFLGSVGPADHLINLVTPYCNIHDMYSIRGDF